MKKCINSMLNLDSFYLFILTSTSWVVAIFNLNDDIFEIALISNMVFLYLWYYSILHAFEVLINKSVKIFLNALMILNICTLIFNYFILFDSIYFIIVSIVAGFLPSILLANELIKLNRLLKIKLFNDGFWLWILLIIHPFGVWILPKKILILKEYALD